MGRPPREKDSSFLFLPPALAAVDATHTRQRTSPPPIRPADLVTLRFARERDGCFCCCQRQRRHQQQHPPPPRLPLLQELLLGHKVSSLFGLKCVCVYLLAPHYFTPLLRARSENLTPLTPPAISHQVDFSNRPAPHHQHSISQRRFDSSNSSLLSLALLLSAVAFPAEALAPSPYTSFLGLEEEEGGDPLVRPSVRPSTYDERRLPNVEKNKKK